MFVKKAGIPIYTTPQGRDFVPDDHPLSYLTMRSTGFRDADLIIVLGTRMTYIIYLAAPPRFGANAKIARIGIDAEELGRSARNVDIPVVGECKSVLQQLIDALPAKTAERFTGWRKTLHDGEIAKRSDPAATTRPTAISTRPASWKRRRVLPTATPSSSSTARRLSISAARQWRPSSRHAGSTPGRSAQRAWACPSRSARSREA